MKYAMLVCMKNIAIITELNNGVEPAPECLENPTYFTWSDDPNEVNNLIDRDVFLDNFEVISEIELLAITEK